jgi:hypothetical protein
MEANGNIAERSEARPRLLSRPDAHGAIEEGARKNEIARGKLLVERSEQCCDERDERAEVVRNEIRARLATAHAADLEDRAAAGSIDRTGKRARLAEHDAGVEHRVRDDRVEAIRRQRVVDDLEGGSHGLDRAPRRRRRLVGIDGARDADRELRLDVKSRPLGGVQDPARGNDAAAVDPSDPRSLEAEAPQHLGHVDSDLPARARHSHAQRGVQARALLDHARGELVAIGAHRSSRNSSLLCRPRSIEATATTPATAIAHPPARVHPTPTVGDDTSRRSRRTRELRLRSPGGGGARAIGARERSVESQRRQADGAERAGIHDLGTEPARHRESHLPVLRLRRVQLGEARLEAEEVPGVERCLGSSAVQARRSAELRHAEQIERPGAGERIFEVERDGLERVPGLAGERAR